MGSQQTCCILKPNSLTRCCGSRHMKPHIRRLRSNSCRIIPDLWFGRSSSLYSTGLRSQHSPQKDSRVEVIPLGSWAHDVDSTSSGNGFVTKGSIPSLHVHSLVGGVLSDFYAPGVAHIWLCRLKCIFGILLYTTGCFIYMHIALS